jgi:hypothetical protein
MPRSRLGTQVDRVFGASTRRGRRGRRAFRATSLTGLPNPTNYVVGSNGLGISVISTGSALIASDFFNPSVGLGAPVPGSPGADLLQMDFLASSNASGVFGVVLMGVWGQSSFIAGKCQCERCDSACAR